MSDKAQVAEQLRRRALSCAGPWLKPCVEADGPLDEWCRHCLMRKAAELLERP